jgi:hypothetical protein
MSRAAAATVQGSCARCGEPFDYAPGDRARQRRYCGDRCRDEARHERACVRRGLPPDRRPEVAHELPPDMPPPPD